MTLTGHGLLNDSMLSLRSPWTGMTARCLTAGSPYHSTACIN